MSGSHAASPNSGKLTSRQVSVIRILTRTASSPVTVKEIAQQLKVSTRTVLRELPAIEQWFDENGFTLIRKPGVGLIVEENAESVRLLNGLLTTEQVQTTYSRDERRREILGELLCAKEPIKSYVFTSRFHISEGTLSGDLDTLGEWLARFEVRMIRRPGVGILLEGSETAIRQATANAALDFIDEGEILRLLRGDESAAFPGSGANPLERQFFRYIDPQILTFVAEVMQESEKALDIRYTDSGYMALVVHLSLAIRRLLSGERIEMDADTLQELQQQTEYPTAREIARRISRRFSVEIPEEEVGFITMHLTSARIWPQSRKTRSQLRSVNTRQVVMTIVSEVEKDIGLPFHTCTRMIEELTSHMESMISRLSMNLHLDNDQVENIRGNYPDIYQSVERACGVIKRTLMIEDISPSEVAFVAMHFVAAAETLRIEQKQVAVTVVCPSGMGASRMLAANLMRSFHNIEIRQISSAFSLEADALREAGIDLIISTVPLEIDFPHICVSPIPQAQDTLLIAQAAEEISASRKRHQPPVVTRTQAPGGLNRADIISLTRTGAEISQLLDHFTLREMSGIRSPEELLGQASAMFADSLLTRRIISNDLAEREAVQSTFLPELGIYLLHCRCMAVDHCRFGYIRLAEPIQATGGKASGAVILLAPAADWDECVEVISRLSMLLVENEVFLQALSSGDVIEGKALAEQALVKYYESEIKKRIGDGTV